MFADLNIMDPTNRIWFEKKQNGHPPTRCVISHIYLSVSIIILHLGSILWRVVYLAIKLNLWCYLQSYMLICGLTN
jgi:hypothetical protein